MKYILDVNALVAMHHANHPFHKRFHAWASGLAAWQFFSCAISDLGFIRISMAGYNYRLETARGTLEAVKRASVTGYIDALPPPKLARWVASHKHTTDAYLCQLAATNGMKLATFDTSIKDTAAFLIP